jgi:broad specificity phosphatase PhoE
MSTLFIVRHGQASFFEADYDRLSPLGERQARLLGEYWAARSQQFTDVYTGPRQRHIETARLVGEAFRAAGHPWPEPQVHSGLDEYAAEEVLAHSLPKLVESDQHIAQLHQALDQAGDRAEKLRAFQRLYEVVIDRWAHGRLPIDGVEPWSEFFRRVQAALDEITSRSGNRAVVAFSSGGPVGVSVGRALGTDHRATLQLAWMIRNGAFAEFLYSRERFTLSRYNAFPHLDDPELLTYR